VRQVVTEVRQQQLQGQAAGGAGATSNGSSSAGSSSSSSPLSQVVAISLARLREQAGALLTQLTAPGSGLGGIDFLGAVLLTELLTAVADGLPGRVCLHFCDNRTAAAAAAACLSQSCVS
jgi:hypothetical protein